MEVATLKMAATTMVIDSNDFNSDGRKPHDGRKEYESTNSDKRNELYKRQELRIYTFDGAK
jgi:hypothetical protein